MIINNNNNNILTITDEKEIINVINCNFFGCDMYTFIVEKSGIILYCSEIKLNLIDKKISEFLTNDEYDNFRKLMLESIFTNKQVINEIKIQNRIYNIIISPIAGYDLTVKYLLINTCDITKNKKIENEIKDLKIKLEESNSIKSIFLSNISHELKTP